MICPECGSDNIDDDEGTSELLEDVSDCEHWDILCKCEDCGCEFWWDWFDC